MIDCYTYMTGRASYDGALIFAEEMLRPYYDEESFIDGSDYWPRREFVPRNDKVYGRAQLGYYKWLMLDD